MATYWMHALAALVFVAVLAVGATALADAILRMGSRQAASRSWIGGMLVGFGAAATLLWFLMFRVGG